MTTAHARERLIVKDSRSQWPILSRLVAIPQHERFDLEHGQTAAARERPVLGVGLGPGWGLRISRPLVERPITTLMSGGVQSARE